MKVLLAFIWSLGAAAAFFAANGPVLSLDSALLDTMVTTEAHPLLTLFYAPWCGHCKNAKPEYEQAAKSLKGLVKVAAVNCDEQKNKKACRQYEIKGFPTIKLLQPRGKGLPAVQDYAGPRKSKPLADFALQNIPNYVERVTSANLQDFLDVNNASSKVLLFSSKGPVSPMYKSLAIDFLGRASFGYVRDNQEEAMQAFGVTTVPRLLLLPGGNEPVQAYEGDMKHDAMQDFIAQLIAQPVEGVDHEDMGFQEKVLKPSANAAPRPANHTLLELMTKDQLLNDCFSLKQTCTISSLASSGESKDEAWSTKMLQKEVLLDVCDKAQRLKASSFKFLYVDSDGPEAAMLQELLALPSDRPATIAVHGVRQWYAAYEGDFGADGLGNWLEDLRIGSVKKEKLPSALAKLAQSHDEL